jgi:hypothetical protein
MIISCRVDARTARQIDLIMSAATKIATDRPHFVDLSVRSLID